MVFKIPPGKVASYGLIADLAGLPGRARLVGSVLRNTPDKLHIPWHRVLKSNGQLAFKAGGEKARRQADLLWQEGVVVSNNRVSLKRYLWQPELSELLLFEY